MALSWLGSNFPGILGISWGVCSPCLLASPNPQGPNDSESQHLVPSLWVQNQIRLPSICGLCVCVSSLAELLEGASQKAISQCMAKVGHIVLLLEDLWLGVSLYFSLKKVVRGTCQCWLLGLQGVLYWHRCTRAFSSLPLLLWDSAHTRCLWQMLLLEHLNHCPKQTVVLQEKQLWKHSLSTFVLKIKLIQ